MSSLLRMLQFLLMIAAAIAQVQDSLSFPRRSSGEEFRNMIVVGPYVVVGSNTTVYALSSSLSQIGAVNFAVPNLLLLGNDPNNLAFFCGNMSCNLSPVDSLANTSWNYAWSSLGTPIIANVASDSAAGALATDSQGNTVLVYGERERPSAVLPSRIKLGRIVQTPTSTYIMIALQSEINTLIARVFLTSFNYNNFVFFVFQLQLAPGVYQTRVARVCGNDTGARIGGENFDRLAYYEVELKCQNSAAMSMPTAAAFVPSSSAFNYDPTIIVSSLISGTNYFCPYSLTTIISSMNDKFTSCANGIGSAGLSRTGNIAACLPRASYQGPTSDFNICKFGGFYLNGLEADTALTSSPSMVSVPDSTLVRSITTTAVDNRTLMYAGRADGSLLTFHIANGSYAALLQQVNLSSASVTVLTPSKSGDYIYALTSSQLYRLPVNMCGNYLTCADCTKSSNPICGWCTLTRMCVRSKDCPSDPDAGKGFWVQQQGQCPSITGINPSTIYVPSELQMPRNITLFVTNVPLLTYSCVYSYSTVSMVTAGTTISNNSIVCAAPSLSSITIPPSQDSLVTSVSLQRNGVNFVSLQNSSLSFTNCSRNTGCVSCTMKQGCVWCLSDFVCVTPSQNASCTNAQFVNSADSCPQILAPSQAGSQYLIHTNTTSQLVLNGKNLLPFSNNLRCVGSVNNSVIFNITASLSAGGNTINCSQSSKFVYSGRSSSVLVRLSVVVLQTRAIDNPGNYGVTLYNCSLLGTNCAQCLSLDPSFACSSAPTAPDLCVYSPGSSAGTFGSCPLPNITKFTPTNGPINGGTQVTITGTNLGHALSDITAVSIGNVPCVINPALYEPGTKVVCITSSVVTSLIMDHIQIRFITDLVINSTELFNYLVPRLNSAPTPNPFNLVFSPSQGPISGGTVLSIWGDSLNIGSFQHVTVASNPCQLISVTSNVIKCTTPPTDSALSNVLVGVTIDQWSSAGGGFSYVPNPTFKSIEPSYTFPKGGTICTISGAGFSAIQNPVMLVYVTSSKRQSTSVIESQNCTIVSDSVVTCVSPDISSYTGGSIAVTIGLRMDGVMSLLALNASINVFPKPSFTPQNYVLQQNGGTIFIQGTGFLFTKDQVRVVLNPCQDSCSCVIIRVTNTTVPNTIECRFDKVTGLYDTTALKVTVAVGNQVEDLGNVMISKPVELIIILIPVFASVTVVGVAFFMCVVAIFCRKTHQKDRRYDQLMLELEKLESSVARECKQGFADLQTDLDELSGEMTSTRLPYLDLQTYLLTTMFPGATDHPVLHHLPPSSPSVLQGVQDFHTMLQDKATLMTLIKCLESQRGFTIKDKSLVGSLLLVCFHQKLDYATEILKTLLSDLIRTSVANHSPKLMLRRTETVAEKMLSNWLAFCLHSYILEHVGQPLYLLFRAMKSQLEKGPVDVLTGEARYSLSEQKLIRQKLDVRELNITVETEAGVKLNIKLLDCDTISQAKEKILDAVYKAAPVSTRPKLDDVDLEYTRASPVMPSILRDEDDTSEIEGGWLRLNTLGHYMVNDGSLLLLVSRKNHPEPGRSYDHPASLFSSHNELNRGISETEDGIKMWHLFKQVDTEDARRSPFSNKRMVSEIYFPRMLSTKTILQKFVDDLFNSIFTTTHAAIIPTTPCSSFFPSPGTQVPRFSSPGTDALPVAIKYLFDFLDSEAMASGVDDNEVLHTWKNNALALRFWINVIKNPEFVFDINKSQTMDACLSVVAQAFIDGCSSAEVKLSIESPTSKLLYNKEVHQYKEKVKSYYDNVRFLPHVSDEDMHVYLKQLSSYQSQLLRRTGGFCVESACNELLKYAVKYHEAFLRALTDAGLTSKAQIFEGILRTAL